MIRSAQEAAHPANHDYVRGSPHLSHQRLRIRLEQSLTEEVRRLRKSFVPCRVLEVGAGHGAFTRVLREAGAEVTITEMSRPAADKLRRMFRDDVHVTVVADDDGRWIRQTDSHFELVAAVSVLHHIPDYLEAVDAYADHTTTGGSFFSWQDPLWYDRLPRYASAASAASYAAWRITQGDVVRGLARRLRRTRGLYDEANPSDMAEYHVVRRGVDEEALLALLASRYDEAQVIRYWSTQAAALQGMGERLGLANTFGLVAHGRTQPT